MGDWFGSTWATVGYVVASTVAIYVSVLLALRVAGRRTVAQFSSFDVVVTIALGSLVATTAVSSDGSYVRGVAALATLLSLQMVAGALRVRFPLARRLLDFRPRVVAADGELRLPRSPFGAQITSDELFSRLRERGVHDLDEVRVVIVEPTGAVSVAREGDLDRESLSRLLRESS